MGGKDTANKKGKTLTKKQRRVQANESQVQIIQGDQEKRANSGKTNGEENLQNEPDCRLLC